VQSAAFSPDGKFIVTASRDTTIKIWQTDTGKLLQTLPDENVVRDAVFSPDGQTIVTGNESCQIKIWRRVGDTWGRLDGSNWKPHETLPELGCGDTSEGDKFQRSYINSVSFDPKGQFLVTASRDRRVFVRDTQRWQKQGEALVGHQGEVYSVDYSADGKFVISASEDHRAILWETRPAPISPQTSTDELKNIASRRLFRDLDCYELRRFQLPCEMSKVEDCCRARLR
jgi:WD40 repeat protein